MRPVHRDSPGVPQWPGRRVTPRLRTLLPTLQSMIGTPDRILACSTKLGSFRREIGKLGLNRIHRSLHHVRRQSLRGFLELGTCVAYWRIGLPKELCEATLLNFQLELLFQRQRLQYRCDTRRTNSEKSHGRVELPIDCMACDATREVLTTDLRRQLVDVVVIGTQLGL